MRNDGANVANKISLVSFSLAGDFDGRFTGLAAERNRQLACAIFQRVHHAPRRNFGERRFRRELRHAGDVRRVAGRKARRHQQLGIIVLGGELKARRLDFQRDHLLAIRQRLRRRGWLGSFDRDCSPGGLGLDQGTLGNRNRSKFLKNASVGGVEQSHHAIRTGGGNFAAVRGESDRVNRRVGHRHSSEFFDALGLVFFELLFFLRFAGAGNFPHDVAQSLGNVVGIIVSTNEQLTGAIQSAATGNAFAIGAETDTEHAARHREEVGNELGVVPNLAFDLAEDAIDARQTVRTSGNDMIEQRVSDDRQNAAFQSAGRDGGDVIDESLFGKVGKFHTSPRADYSTATAENRRPRQPDTSCTFYWNVV